MKRFLILIFIFTILILFSNCTKVERDNPLDPGSINYDENNPDSQVVFFFDDFDKSGGMFGPDYFINQFHSDLPFIQGAKTYSDGYAVRMRAVNNDSISNYKAFNLFSHNLDLKGYKGKIKFSLWVYVTNNNFMSTNSAWLKILLKDDFNINAGAGLYLGIGNFQVSPNYVVLQSDDAWIPFLGEYPLDKWFKMELTYDITEGILRVTAPNLDYTAHHFTTKFLNKFEIRLEIERYTPAGGEPGYFYIDDIKIIKSY